MNFTVNNKDRREKEKNWYEVIDDKCNITNEIYESIFWPQLRGIILKTLIEENQDFNEISLERIFSYIFKCVSSGKSKKLEGDLLLTIRGFLVEHFHQLQTFNEKNFVEGLNFLLNKYLTCIPTISSMFAYLEKNYIQIKLKSTLIHQLTNLFINELLDMNIDVKLFKLIRYSFNQPFLFDPSILFNLITKFYQLKPELANENLDIFSRYIPNVNPELRKEDINKEIKNVSKTFYELSQNPNFSLNQRKRQREG